MASGSVVSTSLVSDVVLAHVLVTRKSKATIAPIVVHGAGKQHLRRDVDVGPLSLSHDLYSVRNRRGSGLSPARSAVLGNVLILQVSEIVGAVDIVPDMLLRRSHIGQLGLVE